MIGFMETVRRQHNTVRSVIYWLPRGELVGVCGCAFIQYTPSSWREGVLNSWCIYKVCTVGVFTKCVQLVYLQSVYSWCIYRVFTVGALIVQCMQGRTQTVN
eukprot:Lankesteria_metandrocarpae@DN7144_c0_g1_i3.p2